MSNSKVAVVMGSDSDWETMEGCVTRLREFGLVPVVEVMSAHRTPQRVHEFASRLEEDGFDVVIAAAGMSAALAGSIAALTTLPVIGVPVAASPLNGFDALLSTVQMPPGVPVASVAIGRAGAINAAVLAAQIVARREKEVANRLREFKQNQAREVESKNRALKDQI
jgi:phosphoribosylaminoimidazole carboxylase PurE protein